MRLPALIRVDSGLPGVSAQSLQTDGRKISPDRHADERVLLLHLPLGGRNARVALEELRGHGHRDLRHFRGERRLGDAQLRGQVAGQHGDGVLIGAALLLHGDELRLRGFQRGFGGCQIAVGRRARLVFVARDLERALVERDGTREQRAQGVGGAQIEIIRRERRLGRELGIREIGLAHLHSGLAALDLAADRSPDIGLPGRQSLQGEFRMGAAADTAPHRARHGSRAATAAASLAVEACGDGGKQLRLGLFEKRDGLAILRFVLLDVLIRDVHLTLEPVELGVLEDRPPIAAAFLVLRRGDLPAGRQLLVGVRHRRGRPMIVGSDRAGGEREQAAGAHRERRQAARRRTVSVLMPVPRQVPRRTSVSASGA